MVKKRKDGSLCFCVDNRLLNSVATTDAYPMPRVDELIDHLGNAKFMTTLDLTREYWQVPMEEASRAFTTPFELYQFQMMPFGLGGASATFQWLMDKVLCGLDEFSAAYLDDIVISIKPWKENLDRYCRSWMKQDLQQNQESVNLQQSSVAT